MADRPKSSWAQVTQAICALLTLAAIVFGYFHSVAPIASKQRAEEERDKARLELQQLIKAQDQAVLPTRKFVIDIFTGSVLAEIETVLKPGIPTAFVSVFGEIEPGATGRPPTTARERARREPSYAARLQQQRVTAGDVVRVFLQMEELSLLSQRDRSIFVEVARRVLREAPANVMNEPFLNPVSPDRRSTAPDRFVVGPTDDGWYERQRQESVADFQRRRRLFNEVEAQITLLKSELLQALAVPTQ